MTTLAVSFASWPSAEAADPLWMKPPTRALSWQKPGPTDLRVERWKGGPGFRRAAFSGCRKQACRAILRALPSITTRPLENFGGPHKYGFIVLWLDRVSAMKTTVEVPDELYRRAKAEAALRGRKFRELVEEGLRLALETPRKTRRQPSLTGLMKRARGLIDSGIPDLASNPEHLAGFGRDARHR